MSKLDAELERAAEAIWNAEYLVVVAGPNFDEGSKSPFSDEFCDAALVSKPNKLMGFWGAFYNEYSDKTPHEGFNVVGRWRDRFFGPDDRRKRQAKRRPDDDAEAEKPIPRLCVFTSLVSNRFQKCGIPTDEVYEPLGNVFQWQCAGNPPCCSTVFTPEPARFRFDIDPATKEAPPIKYVSAESRDEGAQGPVKLHNNEQAALEELARVEASKTKDLKPGRDDLAQRVARAMAAGSVLKISRTTQILPERFPDGFVGFAEGTSGKFSVPDLLPGSPEDDETMFIIRAASDAAAGDAGSACQPPARCSHSCAHSTALDSIAGVVTEGTFFPADPSRYQADRQERYTAAAGQAHFASEAHTLATKRSKHIRYNVSVAMLADTDAVRDAGCPTRVLSEDVAQRVATGESLDAVPSSVLYFSHIPSRQTQQEPIGNKHHDVVQVNFPVDANDDPCFELPSSGRISLVCETVSGPPPDAKPPAKKPTDAGPAGELPPHPHDFTNHVWQMVGRITTLADLAVVPRDAERSKDVVEYYLESQQRYTVCIGVKRSHPTMIAYLRLEVPCVEVDGHEGRCIERQMPRLAGARSTSLQARPPLPTPNHVICRRCHGVGRPFVLMNRPGGSKDDGFCHGALAARTKQFKAWEKAMIDSLKQDTNKSIVILEAGCDRRMDASRSYSEKTFKALKSGKCTFVRISPFPLEAKKGNTAPEPNFIALETGVIDGLTQLERIVTEKMNKRG